AVYPFTNQEKFYYSGDYPYLADKYAIAWNLTSIELPSGGKIKVDYEADDYAYVQDKKAMQMYDVLCVKKAPDLASKEVLYDDAGLSSGDFNNFISVKLPEYYKTDYPNITKYDLLRDENDSTMKYLYFKFAVDLGRNGSNYEYVEGYSQIDIDQSELDLAHDILYVALKPADNGIVDAVKINPITEASLNFTRNYFPRIAYGQADPTSTALSQIGHAFGAMLTNLEQFLVGANRGMMLHGQSKRFNPDESIVRLYNPTGIKKGGGGRVWRVRISDEWNTFSETESTSEYGQVFDYTMTENGRTISSGVASYEPLVGGEENPFKEPDFYVEKNLLAANREYYLELPYGESFFPGPSVGYRKVTVSSYRPKLDPGLHHLSQPGRVENEFYTAYDFPTKTSSTDLPDGTKAIQPAIASLNWFKVPITHHITASQGFVVELNDMHGKPKKIMNYSEGGNLINGVEYVYKTDPAGNLSNNATIITPQLEVINNQEIGVDYDFVVDMRESSTTSYTAKINANADSFLAFLFPIIVPIIYPGNSFEDLRFKSVVTTKVINRYALLDEVITYQDGAKLSTKNLAYDSETGEVLLTQASNEYEDEYFIFNYPAHWVYDGMGQAYKNIAFTKTFVSDDVDEDGVFDNTDGFFVGGDEVMIGTHKYWIYDNDGTFSIIDKNGDPIYIGFPFTAKVLRSGRKNIQNTTIASVTSLKSPVHGSTISYDSETYSNHRIINASAVELTEETMIACNCYDFDFIVERVNPYVLGMKNNWRKFSDRVFITQRVYNEDLEDNNYNTNVRTNGYYDDFVPFWDITSNTWTKSADLRWVWSERISKYSHNGMALESYNPLNIYSAVTYGFNSSKLTSEAANARLQDIGFESFEDPLDCPDNYFSFRTAQFVNSSAVTGVTTDDSHTGRRCIRIRPYEFVKMTKGLNGYQE
ncbi:MAG: hypothetical protein PHE56_11075, partial [Bacteroidales bacterium]|nr:hypothetical protein [Bacteroidales bacterium]